MKRASRFACALLAACLVGAAQPALAEPTDADRAAAAVAWLEAQTTSAGVLESSPGSPDLGMTLGAVLAGIAAGTAPATLSTWIAAVEPALAARVLGDDALGTSTDYGLIAKTLLTLEAAGQPGSSFGGLDLVELTSEGVMTGERPGWAKGTNAFGQSYAILALARAGLPSAEAVTFLGAQLCEDGGVPMYFDAGPCPTSGASSDTDGTALAMMALAAAKDAGIAAAEAPLEHATAWLVEQQQPDGSFPSSGPGPVPNTNTTGLAAAALVELSPAASAKATAWIRARQLTEGPDAGAIAHTVAKQEAGLDDVVRGDWMLATTEGVIGLAPVPYGRLGGTSEAVVAWDRPGQFEAAGHRWRTECDAGKQSRTCRTFVEATHVLTVGQGYRVTSGWVLVRQTQIQE